jgi:hypothetical protein
MYSHLCISKFSKVWGEGECSRAGTAKDFFAKKYSGKRFGLG